MIRLILAATVLFTLAAADRVTVADEARPHVVMLVAEREYDTAKTLPEFAREHLAGDYRTTIVRASEEDRNRLEGIEAATDADVLLISVRRRTLPKDQLDLIRRYVSAGKPVIGIRTANHAFCLRRGQPPEGRAVWQDWDREVFGGNYTNHYGNQLQVTVEVQPDNGVADELLTGIQKKPFAAGGSLYQVSPLAEDTRVIMRGRVDGQPAEPVAWTFRRADGGKSFYTSLGHVEDFRGDVLPTLLRNAIGWAVE